MVNKQQFVLRVSGSGSRFVKNLPHDFDPNNYVEGWENISQALHFDSIDEVEAAKRCDPDGDSLTIEPA